MNKILVAIGLILLAGIVWFMFQGSSVSYTATFENEVMALEEELSSLEAEVAAGTLSPEKAAQAQVRIVSRLNAINDSVQSSNNAKLNTEQKTQLLKGLDTLSRILSKYSSTLVSIDASVMTLPENQRPKLNVRGSTSGSQSIAAAVAETVSTVVEHAEDVIADFETSNDIDNALEPEVNTTDEGDMSNTENTDSTEDMTDEGIENGDTDMEEGSPSNEMETSENTDPDAVIEAEAEMNI